MFTKEVLAIDAPAVAASVAESIRQQVMGTLRRRGAVVGLSGGIDSSVVAALCVKALGKERVLGRLHARARLVGRRAARSAGCSPSHLGIEAVVEDIAPALARPRLLRAPGRGHPPGLSRLRRRLEVQDHAAVDPRQRSPERLPAHRAEPRRRRRETSRMPLGRLPAARRGDQLQAARPQDDGVLPRRSAELRRRRARRTGSSTTRASS